MLSVIIKNVYSKLSDSQSNSLILQHSKHLCHSSILYYVQIECMDVTLCLIGWRTTRLRTVTCGRRWKHWRVLTGEPWLWVTVFMCVSMCMCEHALSDARHIPEPAVSIKTWITFSFMIPACDLTATQQWLWQPSLGRGTLSQRWPLCKCKLLGSIKYITDCTDSKGITDCASL